MKKISLELIAMILSTIMVLTALGTLVYINNIHKPPTISNAAELKNLEEGISERALSIDMFKVEKVIINLNSNKNRLRFLEITVHFVPFNKEQIDILKGNEAFIKDTLISLASKMEADELNTVSGKILLEERIKKTINNNFDAPLVKELFFANFVIQ